VKILRFFPFWGPKIFFFAMVIFTEQENKLEFFIPFFHYFTFVSVKSGLFYFTMGVFYGGKI